MMSSAISCTSRKGMSASDVKVGMTAEELREKLYESYTCFAEYDNKILFANSSLKTVTVLISEDNETITKVTTASHLPDNSDFEKLSLGMTMPEVHELLGAPIAIPTNGIYTELFRSAQGDYYRIFWNGVPYANDPEQTIGSVRKNREYVLKRWEADTAETTGDVE